MLWQSSKEYCYALVNRFRCPKEWKRVGGSCYYLSAFTSVSATVNKSCHDVHSNRSHLIQIQNTVELFYAAHVLLKNNLSSLLLSVDPKLIKLQRSIFLGTNLKGIEKFYFLRQGPWRNDTERSRTMERNERKTAQST
ncbi:unnamed protein product [Rotaria magnacalcarata]|uniref:Uncharacterized protein n=1 Tax=Rotaria magnacalcarata TaxID=392030 RepID=A0A8S3G0G3_9BILA|nr:unnamed protein product [Rotaria magnacalcarata]CAF5147793.1 unnamed protein product [Rotaria magnacalcarata]CAF5217182.1 unnamed protein product [Rotaria magnacalcarata]